MYYVYILRNNNNRLYIGLTNDLERRLKEHNNGYHYSTKAYRPYNLIYKKQFSNRTEARLHEKHLKTGNVREKIHCIIAGWRSGISQGS